MKIPPSPERVAPAASAVRTEHDRSFLIFAGVVLMAMAIGFKSELLGEGQVWALALGLIVVAAPALLGYLRGTAEFPRIEHYIPVALGATTLAGLSLLVPELWKYLLLTAVFGAGFILAARLDYLRLRDEEKRGHVVLQETIIILALAVWPMVTLQGALTRKLGVGRAFRVTLILNGLAALGIFVAYMIRETATVTFAAYVIYSVGFELVMLQFWIFVSQHFNVLEGKRIFPVIAAGLSIGYILAGVTTTVVAVYATEPLLFIWAFGSVAAAVRLQEALAGDAEAGASTPAASQPRTKACVARKTSSSSMRSAARLLTSKNRR